MKKILLFLMLLISSVINGQTVLYNDNCEVSGYNWFGFSTNPQFPNIFSTYLGGTTSISDGPSNKPLYVSNSSSFGLFGLGGSGSGSEYERYQLPNITGLNPNKLYRFTFKLMAYAENITGFSGSGLDVTDSVTVRVSVNNGPYQIESIIKGWSNSYWSFDATGIINETANGLPNTYRPISAGNQENTGFGYSTYNLLLTNISQIQIRIDMRSNYGGSNYGEWWVIDDMELIDEDPLPVELMSFDGMSTEEGNLLLWKTASEHNSDYFLIQSTIDGEKYTTVDKVGAAGNSNQVMEYSLLDTKYGNNLTYYRLLQYDFDGKYTIYGPILINNQVKEKKVIKIIDLMGKEVTEFSSNGIYIEVYEDGTMSKVWR